jgi:hypothetical protein
MASTLKPKQPKPSAAHKRLEVFIGDWHAEGTSYGDGQDAADPRAAGVAWTSDESYEWLPGSFFVLHRWDAQMGKHEFKGAEIIGYDQAEGGYFTRMFDNAGHHPDYAGSVDGEVWCFTEAQTRVTVTVQNGGDEMSFNWEWKNGGRKWLPLCDRVALRTGRAPLDVAADEGRVRNV